MSVTFKDVAKLAGVSTQTVSRVTNGADSVSPATRDRVNAAIKALGYVPNKGAQMLSRAKSHMVGVVSLDLSLHGVALIDSGIRQQAQQLGYGTALSVVSQTDMDAMKSAIRELMAQQVDAIIINAPLDSGQAVQLVEKFSQLRLVFIDVPPDTPAHSVCAAHYEGASLAAQHLIHCGRERFVLISGPQESTASSLRLQGWQEILSNHQAQVVLCETGNWQAESGYLAIKTALARRLSFDAVLVASDQMALGVLCALNEHGIRVPDNVSVVGFDGQQDSAYFTPALTTIEQDFFTIGQQAVKIAIESDNRGAHQRAQITVPVTLIQRESSAMKVAQPMDKNAIIAKLEEIKALL